MIGAERKRLPQWERGSAHQYFLTRFASAEGKNGGKFYSPYCVVEMLALFQGHINDPAFGSGGMFVQLEQFVESHGDICLRNSASSKSEATLTGLKGKRSEIGTYGQDKWTRWQRPFGLATRTRG